MAILVRSKFPIHHSRNIPIPVRITIFPNSWQWYKKSSMNGEAPHGGFFFTTPATPFMGKNCDLHRNWNVPFVTHRKFQNTLLAASPLVEYFPVPKSPNDSIGTIPALCHFRFTFISLKTGNSNVPVLYIPETLCF